MNLPAPRGPLSAAVISALTDDDPSRLPDRPALDGVTDPLADDDLELALWICYELHYQGFGRATEHWEWHPDLIGLRIACEEHLLASLTGDVEVRGADLAVPVPEALWAMVERDDGPPLSRHLQSRADLGQFREFAVHRSIYQLKEADPHTWAIPRLSGRVKAALIEIQADEYGEGQVERMHSELYRRLLRELQLSDRYGAYVDAAPGITLALSNVQSLFALRRSLRGALVGHLAAYEMTSSAPCRRYAKGLRRLGLSDEACTFHDVHVTADALHEQLAVYDLCGALATDEPDLAPQILFGAAVCLHVENRFARHITDAWSAGTTSLRGPLAQGTGGSGADDVVACGAPPPGGARAASVRSVAQRLGGGTATSTQGDHPAGGDLLPFDVAKRHRSADDQRAVGVDRDAGGRTGDVAVHDGLSLSIDTVG